MAGFSWMTDFLGASAKLAVEVAWGANLTADPATWTWTEITHDVLENPGITAKFGRADEASQTQPAEITMRLRNRTGGYSLGGESANWPNVRQGTPVRVRVDPDGSGFVVLAQANLVGISPDWPILTEQQGNLLAAGALRRLGQGVQVTKSAYRRGMEQAAAVVVAYWPCEDQVGSVAFEPMPPSLLAGEMIWSNNPSNPTTGYPQLQAISDFACSRPLPKFKGASIEGGIWPYNAGANFMFHMLVEFGQSVLGTDASIATLSFAGTAAYFDLHYTNTGTGALSLRVLDRTNSLIASDGPHDVGFHAAPHTGQVHLQLSQSGANINVAYGYVRTDGTYQVFTFTLNSRTFANCHHVYLNSYNLSLVSGVMDDVGFGHVVVRLDGGTITDDLPLLSSHSGELASTRLARLASENSESMSVLQATTTQMGPQSSTDLVTLFREAETADQGVLYDGRGPGLTYAPRAARENRLPDLTLSATAHQVKPVFGPVMDDQRIRNKAQVTLTDGGAYEYADTSGRLGTAAIGTYDTQVTASLSSIGDAQHYAEWLVHLGTQEGYRYPTISVNLADSPSLARTVLGIEPGYRIDITGLDSTLAFYYPGTSTLSLIVEGAVHHVTAKTWKVEFQCSLFEPWRVATLPTSTASPAAYIDANGMGAADNASVSVAVPTHAQRNDLLIILASTRNSGVGTVNTPSGWTVLKTSGNFSIFGKVCGDPASEPIVTVTYAGGAAGDTNTAQMFAVTGTDAPRQSNLANVVHASAAQLNASAQNIATPALTITQDNCLVVMAWWKQTDSTLVDTSGVAAFDDGPPDGSTTTGNHASCGADTLVQSTHANISSGTLTVTGGAAAISRAIVLALLPDSQTAQVPILRLDTPGSTLNSSISAGATSMSVQSSDASIAFYYGAGAVTSGNNVSLTPALPGSFLAGDLFLCVATIRNSGTGTVNTPTNWTNLVTSGNVTILGKVAETDDAAPTVSFSGGAAGATTTAQCFGLRGTHRDIGLVVAGSQTLLNGSAQNITIPSITTTEDALTIFTVGWKQTSWTSVATLTGYLELSDNSFASGSTAGVVVDAKSQTTAGTENPGSFTVTGGVSAISRAIVVALRPNPGTTWTTTASDYPLDLDVGGVKITATACTDAISPQTMTINAAPVARTGGVPVQLWRPPTLARP